MHQPSPLAPRPKLLALATLACVALASGCGGSASSGTTYGDLTITSATTWSDETVTVTGKITIASGGSLVLDHVTLEFMPDVEDSLALEIRDGGSLRSIASTIRSGSGKQWNMEAHGSGTAAFEQGSLATNHSGLRFYGSSTLTSDASEVEEIQVHDDATLNLTNGSAGYVVCFFTGAVNETFAAGEFASGTGITRSFTLDTSPTTTGTVNISASEVYGFQIDLEDSAQVAVTDGSEIVLALHLQDYVNNGFTSNITSGAATTGSADFSGSGGPRFDWTTSQITAVNLYLGGASNLVWNGTTTMVEVNVFDGAQLTLSSSVSLWADLLQTYDTASATLNGVTLLEDSYTHPSITAEGTSTITINGVNATANTAVYEEGGTVTIIGGTGW